MTSRLCLFLVLISNCSFAQIQLNGVIKGSDNTLLDNVNILAFPENKDVSMSYTITNETGNYTIELKKNTTYKITLSHIGYVTLHDTLVVNSNSISKNFLLELDKNTLSEVVLNYTPPVSIKKDTTTYQVDAFTDGNERKLREILKKLPGVTVDRDGNVMSQGKKVTKVLVENKTFFNGKSKLAVNNIPADVVEEIEIIDDYHETAFMKGLETSEDVAMNINLKENKKNFIFGDIEGNVGIENRYKLHPTIFKYGEKATYNYIGDLNNTAQKSFTLKDYVDFEGGLENNNLASILNSDITKFLRNSDYYKNEHLFNGLNMQFNPNPKHEFRIFGLAFDDKAFYETNNQTFYQTENITENTTNSSENDLQGLLTKVHYKYEPNSNTELKISSKLNLVDLNSDMFNLTQFDTINTQYNTNLNTTNSKIDILASLKSKLSKKNTITAFSNYKYRDDKNLTNWISPSNLFNSAIPLDTDDSYNINKVLETKEYEVNNHLKFYWILNNLIHLNTYASLDYLKNNIDFNNYQTLTDNSINNFSGFENRTDNNYLKAQIYIELRAYIGDILVETKLNYEYHDWQSNQLYTKINKSKSLLLPELLATWEFDSKKELKIGYNIKSDFFNFKNLLLANQINSFNSIFTGNPNLTLSTSNNIFINYRNFKTYGISYYPLFRYRKINDGLTFNSTLNGVYSEMTPLNIIQPNDNFIFDFRLAYRHKYFKINATPSIEIANFYSTINNTQTKNKRNSYEFEVAFESYFNTSFNYNASVKHRIDENNLQSLKNTATTTNFILAIQYEPKNWQLRTSFDQTFFKNKNIATVKSNYNSLNTEIIYNKEDSAWTFLIQANNLLNSETRVLTNYDITTINEQATVLFPRYILFGISYKL